MLHPGADEARRQHVGKPGEDARGADAVELGLPRHGLDEMRDGRLMLFEVARPHHLRHQLRQRMQGIDVEVQRAAEQQADLTRCMARYLARAAAIHREHILADRRTLAGAGDHRRQRRACWPAHAQRRAAGATASPALSSSQSPSPQRNQHPLLETKCRRAACCSGRTAPRARPCGSGYSRRRRALQAAQHFGERIGRAREAADGTAPGLGASDFAVRDLDDRSSIGHFLACKRQAISPNLPLRNNP